MKGVVVGTVLSVVSLGIALVVAEVGFRVVSKPPAKWNDRPKHYYQPEGAKFLTDRDYAEKKPKDTIRVAVVGDSFSFAPYMQYDDAFPKRLERWLNLNKSQPYVEVMNMGVPRYSTTHEVDVVKRAIAMQSDLIILQITLNDPEIKPYRPTALIVEQKMEPTGIFKISKLASFVKSRLDATRSHHEYREYFFELFNKPKTWANFEMPVRQIKKLAEEGKIPLVSVVFPLFGYPVNSEYPFRPIHEKVAGLMKEVGIESLDITDAYLNQPLDRLQVIPVEDRHPNEIGHRIAAEVILEWLREAGKLPAEVFPKLSVAERIGTEIR
jgi:hypothetical protein